MNFIIIKIRPAVITKAIELIDMVKSSGTDAPSLLAHVRESSLDGTVVAFSSNGAEEVFRRRLNDKTGYKYKVSTS